MSKNVIKYGDMFQFGDHRLICGDATDEEIVSKLLGQDQIKLILTDVPYGIDLVEGKKGFVKSKVTE